MPAPPQSPSHPTPIPSSRKPHPRRDYEPGNGPGTGSYEDGTAKPSANVVYEALHSGCPILEGEKWIVTRWIRGAGFDYVPKHGH